ncbi:MAG: N-acetyltransferase family protein [Acidobacteriota bacterium]|nr:N-acetyltransferase family protein [Acidobacteriota bacterium]
MNIRPVNLDDAAQIAEIYNYYIQNTHHTFETEPLGVDEMRNRIGAVIEDYPYLVAEENGRILGYIYAAQFKLRQAYAHSVEVSIYVRNEERQTGIGKSLYIKFLDELVETNIHAIVAGIALPNDASVKFHERLGFEKVARFREIGYKLGRWIDVGYWELLNRI